MFDEVLNTLLLNSQRICSHQGCNRPVTNVLLRGHSSSTYAKFSEKLTFVCVSGGRDVRFSENFVYFLNG